MRAWSLPMSVLWDKFASMEDKCCGSRRQFVMGAAGLALCQVAWSRGAPAKYTLRTSAQEANILKFDPSSETSPGISMEVIRWLEKHDPQLSFSGLEDMKSITRIVHELSNGSMDVFFGAVNSPERRKSVVVLDTVYKQQGRVAVRVGDALDIKNLSDLKALGAEDYVGVPQGSAYAQQLINIGGIAVDDGVVSVGSTIKKLVLGRVRAVYFSGQVLVKYIKDEGLEDKIKILPAKFHEEDVCVMVSKSISVEKLARLKKALAALVSTGELDRLRKKYGVE